MDARKGGSVSLLILTPSDLHKSPKLGIAILMCMILSFCFATELFCSVAEVPTEWGMWVALGMGMGFGMELGLEIIVDCDWDRVDDDVRTVATACCSRLTIELMMLVKSAIVSPLAGRVRGAVATLDVASTATLPDVKCCDFWAKVTLGPLSDDTIEELIFWRSLFEIASKLLEGELEEAVTLFRTFKGSVVRVSLPVMVWAALLTTVEGDSKNDDGSSIALVSKSPPAIGLDGSSRRPRVVAMSTWAGFWRSSDIVSDMEEEEAIEEAAPSGGALGLSCSAIVTVALQKQS